MVRTEADQEFKHFYVKGEDITLISRIEELNEDTLASEKRGNDILSLYMEQLKDFPFLSAEEEKGLYIEIKQKEKEIERFVADWFDLIKNHLKLKGDLLSVKPNSHKKFSINYCCSDNESYRLKDVLLQLEKINAMKKERKRIRSIISRGREKIPNLDDWRKAEEAGEAEILKLISRIRLDNKKVKKDLHQLEMGVTGEGKNIDNWKQTKKELKKILYNINKNLLWIRKKENELIQPHLLLVIHLAKRYRNRGLDLLDLIQEGNRGLMRAVDTFDHQKGNRFISYAIWWIKQSIIRAIHNQSRTMRIPVYFFDRLNHHLNATERLSQEKGREPTLRELAGAMEVSIDHIVELSHIFKIPLSLEDYNRFQAERKWGSINFEPVLGLAIQSDLKRRINSFLTNLSPREREIIKLRFGIDGANYKHSLQEIGRKFNLSRERIRQIERSALIKLRKMRYIQELREFLN